MRATSPTMTSSSAGSSVWIGGKPDRQADEVR